MVDMTNDVIRFEKMFADRFTGRDDVFMELKSKGVPNPVVIHPWKVLMKQLSKRWDCSHSRNQDERRERDRRSYRNEDWSRQNSYDRHRDRARGGENSKQKKRDRSEDGRRDRNRVPQNGRHRERYHNYHSAIKSYQER